MDLASLHCLFVCLSIYLSIYKRAKELKNTSHPKTPTQPQTSCSYTSLVVIKIGRNTYSPAWILEQAVIIFQCWFVFNRQ